VPSGEAFSEGQLVEIDRVLGRAARETGLRFSVFVGEPEGDHREYAERLHAALGDDAPNAILIAIAPGSRVLDIVTGREARSRVPDRACQLAALSMASALGGGGLVPAITTGVGMLGQAAGRMTALPG
jgi:hypothetical protein